MELAELKSGMMVKLAEIGIAGGLSDNWEEAPEEAEALRWAGQVVEIVDFLECGDVLVRSLDNPQWGMTFAQPEEMSFLKP